MTPEREDSSESNSSTSLIVPTLKSDLPPKNKPFFRTSYFLDRQNTQTNVIGHKESSKPGLEQEDAGKATPEICSQNEDPETPKNLKSSVVESLEILTPEPPNKHKKCVPHLKTGESFDRKWEEKNDNKVLDSSAGICSRPLQLGEGGIFIYEEWSGSLTQTPEVQEKSEDIMTKEKHLDGYLETDLVDIKTSKDYKIQCSCAIQACSCAKEEGKCDSAHWETNSSDKNQLASNDVIAKDDNQQNCKDTEIMTSSILGRMESQLNPLLFTNSQEKKRKPPEFEAKLEVSQKPVTSMSVKQSASKNLSPILKFFPLPSPKEVILSSYNTSNSAKNNQEKVSGSNVDVTSHEKRGIFTFGDDSIESEGVSNFQSSPKSVDMSIGAIRKAKTGKQGALIESESQSSKMISSVSFTGICSKNTLSPEVSRDLSSRQRRSLSSTKLDQQGDKTGSLSSDKSTSETGRRGNRIYSSSPLVRRERKMTGSDSSRNEQQLGVPERFYKRQKSLTNLELKISEDLAECSVEEMTMRCIQCFDEEGKLETDWIDFPSNFFLMHAWFVPSESLVDILWKIYEKIKKEFSCECVLPCKHKSKKIKSELERRLMQLGHAIRYWVKTFPVQFELDPDLSKSMEGFQEAVKKDAINEAFITLIDISNSPTYDWMHKMSVRHKAKRKKKVPLVFKHLEPKELAEQLTYMEFKAIRRISFSEYKNYTLTGKLGQSPRLERSIAQFNGLCTWIQCMILSGTTPKERAETVTRFQKVAEVLLNLRNYNSLMAVVGALTCSSVSRLSRTQRAVQVSVHTRINDMTSLLASSCNFSNYRKLLQNLPDEGQCFHLPILGIHLKDLIAINTALPDRSPTGNINVRKMILLAKCFEKITGLHNMVPHIEPNADLINILQPALLCLKYTENEIYELSLAREPRTSNSFSTTEVFADWAAGVTASLDSQTLDKHITCMVEAVFKNYDLDSDGFISMEEFSEIASNYPFIDGFCVLDTNNDGKISKDEMKTYFKTANSVMLRSEFKHDFNEHTYFRLTFCQHCTGLLWGVIKQGVRCRICGLNAHKHCSAHIVMECRGRFASVDSHSTSSNSSTKSSIETANRDQDLTLAAKRRMSKRHRPFRERSCQTDHSCLTPKAQGYGGQMSHGSAEISGQLSSSSQHMHSPGSGGCGTPGVHGRNRTGLHQYQSSYSSDYSSLESSSLPYANNPEDEQLALLNERLKQYEENREALISDNNRLVRELFAAQEKSRHLEKQIKEIKENTMNFLMQQVNTLQLPRSKQPSIDLSPTASRSSESLDKTGTGRDTHV